MNKYPDLFLMASDLLKLPVDLTQTGRQRERELAIPFREVTLPKHRAGGR